MKTMVFILFFSTAILASKPQAIASLSPKEFSGLWYEIARTYNDYEKNCVAATVQYDLIDRNRFDVTNRCFDRVIGGDLIVYEGSAKTLENESASKLKLTYFWVFTREYHIVHMDESKVYAVMASPDMQNLWIMSRTPQMPQAKLQAILEKLSSAMNIKRLIFTPQDSKGRYK